ncbi:RNA polymerase sigma-70 factor [Chitinophaga polysaccharea]|uniref:RNA polymerase sigma-70 factor n=1 Tax=Chitinophaga TaxID=79328 RepID=UPI001454EDF5|nr:MULTISPECIES: RNA polymerase sigma-70 factor [Chitinophaga]NLR60298.1 RNA polymerase sigma-70 factor [Chitinophaga polysaccharea]NLU95946.1 RNA polymerase sigma-70 factor [Chitinophaga sp. Ak27]
MGEYQEEKISNSARKQQEQFSLLFRQYEHRLYVFACNMVQSELLARDIIQEVFIKLWIKKDDLEGIVNIEQYLYLMVRNKVIDVLRKLANDRKLREEYFRHHQWQENKTMELVEVKEFELALAEAISHLPPQRRIIYQLSQISGMSRDEIARELQLSPHTVKNQLTAALSTLRKFVSNHLRFF